MANDTDPLPSCAPARRSFADEVGGTLLCRARNLERALGIRKLHLKFEGGNPTGTQKDRVAAAQALDAAARGYDTITVGTCGNYGAALARAAAAVGLRPVLYIPESFHTRRIAEMTAAGGEVVRVEGLYEAAVARSTADARAKNWYNANPGGPSSELAFTAYGDIAREIVDVLGDAPATVAVPVSNGTTLAGIHDGFRHLLEVGRTTRMPRMIAASSYDKNPIVKSYQVGSHICFDLEPEKVRETAVNEPLINWHSFDGQDALNAVYGSRGAAVFVSDRDMVELARDVLELEGLNALPASVSAVKALAKLHAREPLPEDHHVAVLTARR
jgi:threonine synthase